MVPLVLSLLLQEPSLVDAVRAYLEGRGPAPQGEIAAVERAVKIAMRGPAPKEAGVKTHEVASDIDPAVSITYHVAIPEAKAEALPLLVSLHGQGGDAKEWIDFRAKELKDRAYYVLCPQAGKAGWGHSRLGYSHVLAPLRDAMARYNVDPDRVWIDGGSMGANGAWQIASLWPDRFAAAAPRGGCPHFIRIKGEGGTEEIRPFYARNLKPVAVNWTVGAKDKGLDLNAVQALKVVLSGWRYDFAYTELPEGGHEWFPDETPRITEWMTGKARSPDPPEVRWTSWEKIFNRSYWVEVLDAAGASRIETTVKDFDGRPIEKRLGLDREVRLTAIAKRAQNRIDVDGDGVKELRLWLNDRIVDLSKPVKVTWNNKKVFEGRVEPSVQRMLDEAKRRGDAVLLYPAEITIKVGK